METRATRRSSKTSRANKNRHLYDNLENLSTNEQVIDFNTKTQIDLSMLESTPPRTRGNHQGQKVKIDESSVNTEIPKDKVYDINKVLEEARKAKPEEEKNKFQSEDYSLLDDLNKKYLERREKLSEELEKEGIEEVISSITNTDLSKEFKSLMADDDSDLVEMQDLISTEPKTGLEEAEITLEDTLDGVDTEDISNSGRLINSFYTRSTDLFEDDFDFKGIDNKPSKSKLKVALIVGIVVLILAIATIFILGKFGVI